MEEHDLMKVSEVAAALRVSKMTVYRLVKAGHLETIQVLRTLRIRRTSYDAFLAGGGVAEQ